jgi:ribosomal protein S18 acetylase RimI-like enzyme
VSAVASAPRADRRGESLRIRRTCSRYTSDGSDVLRTPALEEHDARWFVERGFSPVQSLVMLRHELQRVAAHDDATNTHWSVCHWNLRRLHARRHQSTNDAILAVDAESFAAPWNMTRDAFATACRATSDHVVLVASRAAQPVAGYALVGRSATNAYLQRLAVHPLLRRRGIALGLVHAGLAWAHTHGASTMFVNTEPHNQAALTLYASLGFVTDSRRLVVLERPVARTHGGGLLS